MPGPNTSRALTSPMNPFSHPNRRYPLATLPMTLIETCWAAKSTAEAAQKLKRGQKGTKYDDSALKCMTYGGMIARPAVSVDDWLKTKARDAAAWKRKMAEKRAVRRG